MKQNLSLILSTVILLLTVFFIPINQLLANRYAHRFTTPTEIYEKIKRLNFLGTVMYVAAHPDDENTRLISYFTHNTKARVVYLSLTRGDGGQNLLGSEIREALGVMRTQELLEARSVDWGEQTFSRANDFGYSKNPFETFQNWDKSKVLGDVVWAFRKFKPDIIINRFNHTTPGTTHGHHTASAILSVEAFDLSGNKNIFPRQIKKHQAWQPKRLYYNTSWWFYGSKEKFEKVDKSDMVEVNVGKYYPLLGASNNEIAALARSKHRCQGFGSYLRRGNQKEYLKFIKGEKLNSSDIFEGINTSWSKVDGGVPISKLLEKIEQSFDFKNPTTVINDLLKVYKLIYQLEDKSLEYKLQEIRDIVQNCLGFYFEIITNRPFGTKGQKDIPVNFNIVQRSQVKTFIKSISSQEIGFNKQLNKKVLENEKIELTEDISIPESMSYSTPYWINDSLTIFMQTVNDLSKIGLPETPPKINFLIDIEINDIPIRLTTTLKYKYLKIEKGEYYQPFYILPKVSVGFISPVSFYLSDKNDSLTVSVKSNVNNYKGKLRLELSKNWKSEPLEHSVDITKSGFIKNFKFKILPPKEESEAMVKVVVGDMKKNYDRKIEKISYEHIPDQYYISKAQSKLIYLNKKMKNIKIAYLKGAGDKIPEFLNQMGFNVSNLLINQISRETLKNFDVVILGIRSFNVHKKLEFLNQELFDYVRQGGKLIVQYNTTRNLVTKRLAPYNLKISKDRVTNENSKVNILDTDNSVFNYPFKITDKDFNNWIQERGLYFAEEWGKEFKSLLSMRDPNEPLSKGSLLVTKYGKGYYVYTGLSFFRQLPVGTKGAIKLFINLLYIKDDK